MSKIMDFLAEYYLYIALGSLLVIIILILIIVLGNKKKRREEKLGMTNIGEIKTGSITDVTALSDSEVLKPQEISDVGPSIPENVQENVFVSTEPVSVPIEPATAVEQVVETSPVVPSMAAPEVSVNEEVTNTVPTIENTVQSNMNFMNQPVSEPTIPVESSIPTNVELSSPVVESTTTASPVVEPIVATTTPSVDEEVFASVQNLSEPTTVEKPSEPIIEAQPVEKDEELEIFGIEEPKENSSGTAVAGFSSVNVEK